MPTTRRTHVCRIQNHFQVMDGLDNHGWSASKLWNVALYHARQQWDEAGEIPDEATLKAEVKDHPKYNGLHSQSSQNVLEELSESFTSWFGSNKIEITRRATASATTTIVRATASTKNIPVRR